MTSVGIVSLFSEILDHCLYVSHRLKYTISPYEIILFLIILKLYQESVVYLRVELV